MTSEAGEAAPHRRGTRTGYIAGACAAAAVKAATQYLVHREAPDSVAVWLPAGRDAPFLVPAAERNPEGGVRCSVIRDAGDDPDVTHGTEIAARAWATSASSL